MESDGALPVGRGFVVLCERGLSMGRMMSWAQAGNAADITPNPTRTGK